MILGSCMCSKVRYVIHSKIDEIIHCHCTTCRKAHGSAFSSVAIVKIDAFEVTEGKNLINCYHDTPTKDRCFCKNCGSHLYAVQGNNCIVRLGTLDDDPIARPTHHIFISEKASWYDIDNDCKLPRYKQSNDSMN